MDAFVEWTMYFAMYFSHGILNYIVVVFLLKNWFVLKDNALIIMAVILLLQPLFFLAALWVLIYVHTLGIALITYPALNILALLAMLLIEPLFIRGKSWRMAGLWLASVITLPITFVAFFVFLWSAPTMIMAGPIALGLHGIVNYIVVIQLARRYSWSIGLGVLLAFLLLQALLPVTTVGIFGKACVDAVLLVSTTCFVVIFGVALFLFDRDPEKMFRVWLVSVLASLFTLIALFFCSY